MNEVDSEIIDWKKDGKHLPEFMRGFHDQKELFKKIHTEFEGQDRRYEINWIEAHCYTIDWFLWYLATRGYTLQKTKKRLPFKEISK